MKKSGGITVEMVGSMSSKPSIKTRRKNPEVASAVTARQPLPKPVKPRIPRKRNPASRGDEARQAAQLYEKFTGHDARELGYADVKPLPKSALCVGHCDGILYSTVRDGRAEEYIHTFKKKDRPLFCVSPDGTQLLLVGGNYDFTERGIVDRSSKR